MTAYDVRDILQGVGVVSRHIGGPGRWLLYEITTGRLKHDPRDWALWPNARQITVSDTCYPSDPPEYGPLAVDIQFLGPLGEVAPMLDAIRKQLHQSDTWIGYLVDHGHGLWTIANRRADL
jgi:hypothetical protein